MHDSNTVIVDATVDDQATAEAWIRALPAALQDAWVAYGTTQRRVPVRLTGAKVDVLPDDQLSTHDGPAQTPT